MADIVDGCRTYTAAIYIRRAVIYIAGQPHEIAFAIRPIYNDIPHDATAAVIGAEYVRIIYATRVHIYTETTARAGTRVARA